MSALVAARPYGVRPTGAPMDGDGMHVDVDALEETHMNWNAEVRGAAR